MASLRVAIDDREVDLLLVGLKIQEQLVDLVDHLTDAGVRAVNLVNDQHDRQLSGESLTKYEPRLRQWPLRGVDQEQHAVHHRQTAFHLPAKVGVPGGVDDVDLEITPPNGGVLRENRDALLTFQVAGVHHSVGHSFIRSEGAGLPEHCVDQGGFAVIDMGDDRYVSDVFSFWHGGDATRKPRRGAQWRGGALHSLARASVWRAEMRGATSEVQGARRSCDFRRSKDVQCLKVS